MVWVSDVISETHLISSNEQLRQLYREPSQRVAEKKGSLVVGAAADFVAASPFFCLATANADGACDVSPRGGSPGHLKVLDDGAAVAFPDLSGNNLIDSLSNIVANRQAGLLVMVPGYDETLRIDGRASITTDPEILSLWSDELRTPKAAVVIEVASAFLHCAKAFRRGSLWQPESWPEMADTAGPEMFNATAGTDMDPTEMRVLLEADYESSLAAERRNGD